MAKGINIPVSADIRPLQKQIAKATKTPIKLSGINDRAFSQPLGRIKGQMGEFQKSLEASNARVIAFGASAGAIMAIQQAFKSLVTTVVNVEKKLAEVNVILGTNQRNLSRFGSELFSIAKKTEQSFDSVATAATELARQGLGLELTLKRTKDAMILTRLAGISVVDSVESITAALNGFNKAALNSTKVINKIIAVDQAFAVSGKDLAEALKRVGSTAQDAGVSLDELMAVVTTAQQITARGGAVIGNSFKTIFTRIQRPKVIEALQAVGVATKDLTGNSLSAIKVLENLASQFNRLSQSQRSQVAELVGGVFQINVLKAALSDLGKSYSIYDRALRTSLTSADEAQRRNAILNKTLASSANELVVNLQKVGASVGKLSIEPVLRRVLGGVNKALGSLDVGQSEGIGSKIGEGIFKGIGSFLKGPGLALAVLGIFKLFEKLRTFASDAFKTMTGLNQTQTRQAEIQKNIAHYLQNNPKLLDQIKRGTMSVEQVHEKILIKIKQETKEMQDQARIASKISGALFAGGVRLKGADSPDEGRLYTKSGGHIPNFSRTDRIASAVEISSASYAKPSTKVIKSKQPGLGTYYRNSEETITRVPGYKQHFVNPPINSSEGRKHKVNSIRKTGINPYSWNGAVPNFAKTGMYDSDLIGGGGMSKKAKGVLAAIVSSGKRINSVWGPAGSGKSTWAKSKFGGVPVTDASQVGNYQDFVVLYGGNRSKKGGLTAQGQQVLGASSRSGGQIYALVPKGGNTEIMNRRDRRARSGISTDLRSPDQLKNTKRAPVWNYSFLSQTKKQYPNMQIVRNQDGHVPSFAAKAQRKLLHLTPETFESSPYSITDGGYSVTGSDGNKGYLAIKGMNKGTLSKLVSKSGYSTNPKKAKLRDGKISTYLDAIKGHLGVNEVSTPIGRKELLSLASSPSTGIVGAPSNIFSLDQRSGASEEARIKSQLFIGGPGLFDSIPVAVGKTQKGSGFVTKMGHTKGGEEFPLTSDFHRSTQARELHRLMKNAVGGRMPLAEIIDGFDQFAKAADPDVRMLKKGLGFEDFINLTSDIESKLKRDSEVLDFYPYSLSSFPEKTKGILNMNPKSGYGDAKLNPTEDNQVGLVQKWLRWRASKGGSPDQMSEWLKGIINKNQTIDYRTRQEPADKQIALLHSGTGDNDKKNVSVTLSKLTSGSGAQDFKRKYAGLFESDGSKKGGAKVPTKYKSTSGGSKAFGFQFILDAIDVPDTVSEYLDELAESDPSMIERLKSQYIKKMKELVANNKSGGHIPNFIKYQTGQKLPKGRGAGGRHLAVRDQNMGVHWDPKAMFHADLVKRSGLQGKTMDGGWLFPNGRYEKIKGHDGSGLQANGFVPNFARLTTKNKKWKSKDDGQPIVGGGRIESDGGFLTYDESRKALNIEYNKSTKRGAGYAQFQGLVKEARSVGKPIKSGTLVNQLEGKIGERDRLANMPPFSAIAKMAYPQLRQRIGKNLQTSGRFGIDLASKAKFGDRSLDFRFKSLRELESKTNRLKRQDVADAIVDYGGISVGSLVTDTNKSRGIFRRDDSRLKVSSGLIPNFMASPLDQALSREAGSVPKSAIRIGQSNSLRTSGNPAGLGVYNTRDEPRGLGQGISRAKREGRNPKNYGASKGLIPNFAESEPGFFGKQFMGKGMSAEQTASIDKFQDSVFKASFAFGTLTSTIGTVVGDSQSAAAATSKATDAMTNAGTAVQLIPGPAGKVVGGLVLAAGAASAVASAFQSVGDDITAENERLKGVTQTASDNLSKYGEAFSGYVEEVSKGTTDTRRVNDLQKKMIQSLQEIPAVYRSQLMSAKNLTDVQEKIAKAQEEMSKRAMQVNIGATVAKAMDDALGMGDVFGRNVGLDDDVFKGGKGGALLSQFNVDLTRTLDMEKLTTDANSLGAAFNFSRMSSQDFIGSLQNQYGLQGEVAAIMDDMSDAEIKKVQAALEQQVRQQARAKKEFEALNTVLQANATVTNRIREAAASATAALRTFISSGLESMKGRRGQQFQGGANNRALRLERAKAGVSLAEGVLTKDIKLALETQIATLERQEKYYADAEKVMAEGRGKLAEAVRKITEIQPKSKGGSGQQAAKELSPEMASLQRGLLGVLRQTESAGLAETKKAFDDFVKANQTAFRGKNYEAESIAVMKEQSNKLLELKASQEQANRIAEIQTNVQKKLLQVQRDAATAGGIDKFIEGSEKSFDRRIEFVEKLSKFAGFAQVGLTKQESSSGLELNRSIRDFLGGLNVDDPSLRGIAVRGRAQDIRDESGFRIQQIQSLIPQLIASGRTDAASSLGRQTLALQGVRNRAGQIAQRQVDEEVKTRSLPQEISNLISEIKVLNREQASLDTKLGTSLQTAIVQSQMPSLLDKINQQAVAINDNLILQQKQEEKNAAKTELETKNVRLQEAQKSATTTRKDINDLFGDTDIEIAGTAFDLELEAGEVGKFAKVVERFVSQAQKMGVLTEGQGIDALARTGTVDLANVLGNLSASDRRVLAEEARVGESVFGTADAGVDLRNLFGGLMKDTSGFGQKLNQLAMDITTIETIKPTVNDLRDNLNIASQAVADFQREIRRNRPIEATRGRTQTRFGEASGGLRGAIQEKAGVGAARGTFQGITQGLQQGNIRGAQTAVANLAQGVQRGTISRGEMERQLTAIAQSTGTDAGQLIAQVDAVGAARPGRARAQAGARLMGTMTGMSRRGIRGPQAGAYAQSMNERERGASSKIASKIADLQREATAWDTQFKSQYTRNWYGAPDLMALKWDRLNNLPSDKKGGVENQWKNLEALARNTKVTAGFGRTGFARQSAQVQTGLSRLLTNPTTTGLRNVEKLFNEISDTSYLKRFQAAASDYKRQNQRYAFGGHVPNFEKTMARTMGAPSDVKAHMGQGTIGGKRFMMNNYETEISRPGNDSYVLPSYAGGHVPNFASSDALTTTIEEFALQQGIDLDKLKPPPTRLRLPPPPPRLLPRKKTTTMPRDWQRSRYSDPTGQLGSPNWQPETRAPAPVMDNTRLRPRSELDYVRNRWVSPADNPFIKPIPQTMELNQLGGVGELMEELQDLAGRGGGQTTLRRTQDGIQKVNISNRQGGSMYHAFMQKLGLTSQGVDIGRELDDAKLISRFDKLNELFPGQRAGDKLLGTLRSNLAKGLSSGDAFDSHTRGLLSLLQGGKGGAFEKLESMSLNIKKDKTLKNYLNSLLESDPEKAAKFIQGHKIPDKYIKRPSFLKRKFDEVKTSLAEKRKDRTTKVRSAKNNAWIEKHLNVPGLHDGQRASLLFQPPKKGAIDRMVDFKPSKWADAILPFGGWRRADYWDDWVKQTKAIGGGKAPLNQLVSAIKAGIDPIDFASQVIEGRMPYDQFMEERVGAKKQAKAEEKARKATGGEPKKKALRDTIAENIQKARDKYNDFRNRGADSGVDEADKPRGSAVDEKLTPAEQRTARMSHDSESGRAGPEGETKKTAAQERKLKRQKTKDWIKKNVIKKGAKWRQAASDLDTRWAQHTRSHPKQYKGIGSFHTDEKAKFRGGRVMGKELSAGILATMVINKVAGGNVPDYNRKEAVRKYSSGGFSPDPVGVLDVVMDKLPFIGTKSLKASDISGQGLLKDAVSTLLPPPASLMMMSLEEMHRQWFQTLDMVQRTKDEIYESDNRSLRRSANRKAEVGKKSSADVHGVTSLKNKMRFLIRKKAIFNPGEKLPGNVRWGGRNVWPNDLGMGTFEMERSLTGYEGGIEKEAGLNSVIARQAHLNTLANKYIEAKFISKDQEGKSTYQLDNDAASNWDFLNLNSYMGRTVQYSQIDKLRMGSKGGLIYPKAEAKQIHEGGMLSSSGDLPLNRSPLDPITSRAKLKKSKKGNSFVYDFPNPKGGSSRKMWGLFPSRRARKKIGTKSSVTNHWNKLNSSLTWDMVNEIAGQTNVQGQVAGANPNAGAGGVPAAAQMNSLFTGGNVAVGANNYWTAHGPNILQNLGGGNAARAGGPWSSDKVKQLIMNIPVDNIGTTWRTSGDSLPIPLATAMNRGIFGGQDVTKANLGNLVRMSRAQWRLKQNAMQQEVTAATASSRRPSYKPTSDVDRGIMQAKVGKQKTAASFLYRLANQHIKPNPLSAVSRGAPNRPDFTDPYVIRHGLDGDPLNFASPAGHAVNNEYRPLHDLLNDRLLQPTQSRRLLTPVGGTPLGYHMKELFNSGHKGYFDPLALMMLGRTHGIIDKVRTSSNATLSSRPSTGIGFPSVSDFLSNYSGAASKFKANQIGSMDLFSKASPSFRKDAGGAQSELFQFFQNKGRFDRIVAFGGHIPNFAYNFDPSIFGGSSLYGSRGASGTDHMQMMQSQGVKGFGVGMFDYMRSGGSMLGQLGRGRRFRAGNNIRQQDINDIISRTPERMGGAGGFSGLYTPGRGNFGPRINYGSGATGNIVGHERFHSVFDQGQVGSFFGSNAMRFQQRDLFGSMRARSDVANIFDTGSAYNFGSGVREGSLGMTVDSINEMLAYSMMGTGRGGANKFAQGKFDTRLRGSALRSLGGFNDRQSSKAFGGAAKLAGGGDFFDGMMMFEELASKRYFSRGYLPNFNLGESLRRETKAMPSGAKAKVGYDPRLKGGVGVFNSSEGSLKNAINMHMASGKNMSQIQRAGTSGYSAGPVPNFADGTIAQSLNSLAQQTGGATNSTGLDTSEMVNLLSEMVNGIGGLSSVVSTGFETQAGAFSEGMQNVNVGGSLPVNVTLGGTVQDASAAIVNQLQTKVDAFMTKTLTPSQQGEINAMTRFGNRQG